MFASLLSLPAFLALAVAQSSSEISFGPYFWLRPDLEQGAYTGDAWIRESNTTLVLPETPSPQVDRLALWPGMACTSGDLVQAVAVSFASPQQNCGGTAGQWCTMASTLQGTQQGGNYVGVNKGTRLTIHYKYNDQTSKYDQTVTMNGQIISALSTSSEKAKNWQTAVECQEDSCSGSVAAHQYLDTTIVLNAADAGFGATLMMKSATSSGLSTIDGGTTWVVDTINMEQYTFGSSSDGSVAARK